MSEFILRELFSFNEIAPAGICFKFMEGHLRIDAIAPVGADIFVVEEPLDLPALLKADPANAELIVSAAMERAKIRLREGLAEWKAGRPCPALVTDDVH